VRLGKKAETVGNISCRSMAVEAGATLDGYLTIDPQFTPGAAAGGDNAFDLREDAAELTRTGEPQRAPAPHGADHDGDTEDSLLRPETRQRTTRKKKAQKSAQKKTQKKPAGDASA
jgi:hypothetical protein